MMVTFLTSDPLWENEEICTLNEANGFVEVLRGYWKEKSRCLFIASDPYDDKSNDENRERYGSAFMSSGLSISAFDLLDARTSALSESEIRNYDVILLCGGHIPTEWAWFEKLNLRHVLKGFDGILIGISAGSMNSAEEVFALPELSGELDDPEYSWFFSGLDCVKTSIIPHFQAVYGAELDGRKVIEEVACGCSMGKYFLGLPDGSFVVADSGVELVFGEAYLIMNGEISLFCLENECREYLNYGPFRKDVTVIGASIVDVLAGPVSPALFRNGSEAMAMTKLSYGGDALNEAVVLSRLGKKTELITKAGTDEAGARVYDYIKKNGIVMDSVKIEEGLMTGMNIVLVDEKGERYFLTNPESSLRKLSVEDVDPYLNQAADIVCFASMFVSPKMGIGEMEYLFKRIKSKPGRILVADMTKAKNGETLDDVKGLLPYVDYILPNEEEIALLTGCRDPYRNAELLVEAGAGCAVIKRGEKGCLIRTREKQYEIPAYRVRYAVDSTGAGDCFAAGFVWALSEGFSLKDCGRFANVTASISVEHFGAVDGITNLKEPMKRMWKKWHFNWKRRH